jgi:hypothetical protein
MTFSFVAWLTASFGTLDSLATRRNGPPEGVNLAEIKN